MALTWTAQRQKKNESVSRLVRIAPHGKHKNIPNGGITHTNTSFLGARYTIFCGQKSIIKNHMAIVLLALWYELK